MCDAAWRRLLAVLDVVAVGLSKEGGGKVRIVGMDKDKKGKERALPGSQDAAMWCRGEADCWFRKSLRFLARHLQPWEVRGINTSAKYAEVGAEVELLKIQFAQHA